MRPLPHSDALASDLLQERYGHGYFHGEGSGFAKQGYDSVHATWDHWMTFVRDLVGAGARWLDVGCAYGFLVEEARQAGFRAVGIDASRFAIDQAKQCASRATGKLAQAHAEWLPIKSRSMDVVTAFDLLEHLLEPTRAIEEAARVLVPGGLFIAATPDPLVFDRDEPTHIAERVPSWWVQVLERAGFATAIRFFQAPYNLEVVARLGGPAPLLGFDRLGFAEPVLDLPPAGELMAALRSGFGVADPGGASGAFESRARVVSDGAVIYLLNRSSGPLKLRLSVDTIEPVELGLELDGRILSVVVARPPQADGERLDGEGSGSTSHVAELLLPRGGHSLRFTLPRGWATLVRLGCWSAASDREALCRTLPFDLFERYSLAARVVRELEHELAPKPYRLLDVGGTIGGGGGHLAWSGDFFSSPELEQLVVLDGRAADYPEHVAADVQGRLSFPDRAFDVVTALDVLEHVPAESRGEWLAEVWRVTRRLLLLGGPFATPGAAEADRYLLELIRSRYGYQHRFLAEHLAFGHPDVEATTAYFVSRGASVTILPSGYLPAWILMQTVNAWLSHPRQTETFPLANAAFNSAVGLKSTVEPAYRHLLVVDRAGADHRTALEPLIMPTSPDLAAVVASLAVLPGVSTSTP